MVDFVQGQMKFYVAQLQTCSIVAVIINIIDQFVIFKLKFLHISISNESSGEKMIYLQYITKCSIMWDDNDNGNYKVMIRTKRCHPQT